MIIFDLDGTLADCEHRLHFVDYIKVKTSYGSQAIRYHGPNEGNYDPNKTKMYHEETGDIWKRDWKSFYEACDQDKPIWPVIEVYEELTIRKSHIQIWSARCESVRSKTEEWLKYFVGNSSYSELKMRPIGENAPDDQLKERWLNEEVMLGPFESKTLIDFVFDSDPKSIAMWRRRGIFVFNCCQYDGEF
jgi:hypothetical protein